MAAVIGTLGDVTIPVIPPIRPPRTDTITTDIDEHQNGIYTCGWYLGVALSIHFWRVTTGQGRD